MREVVCLSGWGQKFDSLEYIFDHHHFSDFKVSSYNYFLNHCVDDFFCEFSKTYKNIDCIIGWSLGGQLASRLIAKKIIKPKLLILIAPPFQFVKNSKIKAAMPKNSYQDFLNNFKAAPNKTIKKFSILTIINDINSKNIIQNLALENSNNKSLIYWLQELGRFSCFDIDFDNFPSTLYFHGIGDMIVHNSQKDYFKEKIRDLTDISFEKCGHAPHISKEKEVRNYIYEFFKQKLY